VRSDRLVSPENLRKLAADRVRAIELTEGLTSPRMPAAQRELREAIILCSRLNFRHGRNL